ncbi:MAG: rod shape-determining protein MreC [Phycisphaeraceae bacterium]
MNRSPLTPRRLLTLVVVLLLITSLLPLRYTSHWFDGPRHALATLLSPASSLGRTLADKLRPMPREEVAWDRQESFYEEYGRAIRQVRKLQDQLRAAHDQIARYSQLRNHLDFEGVTFVDGRVRGAFTSRARDVLTVGVGENRGVQPGFVAAHAFNLVGRVETAGQFSADVRLITAITKPLQVRITPPTTTTPRELVTWIQPGEKPGQFVVEKIDLAQPISRGDLAHLADPTWPEEAQALVVGQVTQVEKDPADPTMFRRAIIEPIHPLPALSRLTILVPTE